MNTFINIHLIGALILMILALIAATVFYFTESDRLLAVMQFLIQFFLLLSAIALVTGLIGTYILLVTR
jgi:hypothetical protein